MMLMMMLMMLWYGTPHQILGSQSCCYYCATTAWLSDHQQPMLNLFKDTCTHPCCILHDQVHSLIILKGSILRKAEDKQCQSGRSHSMLHQHCPARGSNLNPLQQ
jgi:hypothetical protein